MTLVWSDYPGTGGTPTALVNNLNLVVKDPTCTVLNGNHFVDGESVSGGIGDNLNVEEAVHVSQPASGLWSISVRSVSISQVTGHVCGLPDTFQVNQPFALVATGKTGSSAGNLPPIAATSEDLTGLRTIVSGSFVETQVSDNIYEVLEEVLNPNGVSVLEHVWQFSVTPLRSCLTLNVEGNRPNNSEYDNFKFYWSEAHDGLYTEIPNAVINKIFDVTGGFNYPFAWSGSPSGIIYIKIKDTSQVWGSSLDRVKIDRLEIR